MRRYSLHLERPSKARVLKAWSLAHGATLKRWVWWEEVRSLVEGGVLEGDTGTWFLFFQFLVKLVSSLLGNILWP